MSPLRRALAGSWRRFATAWREHDERRRQVLGINARNLLLVARHDPRRARRLADDKLLTKRLLEAAGVPVPETLAVFETFGDLRGLEDLVSEVELVLKPAQGKQGQGILVLGEGDGTGRWRTAGGRELTLRELKAHVADILFGAHSSRPADRALAERRLHPHPALAELGCGGLPDVRVLVLEGRPRAAMVRLPTRRSGGRANLHQAAVGVGIDLATGRSTSASWAGRPVERHPDTGTLLLGRPLPAWSQVLDVARRAAAALPLGFLGVDVALDARQGPVVLEVNARPGLEIQNVNARGLARELGAVPGPAPPERERS